MTDYDEMTEDELEQIYKLTFNQRYPDRSLLLRRVLKYRSALKELVFKQEGYPASAPPRETGVYLIHNGLGFRICEYDVDEHDDGEQWGWIDEVEDEINVVRWWHLPPAPRNSP